MLKRSIIFFKRLQLDLTIAKLQIVHGALLGIKGDHLGKSLSKISKAEEKFNALPYIEG